MWPFSEMSLATASLVGTIANWVLLVSLLSGVLSTFVIVKTSDVKEDHWAEDRRISNERIAELTTQGDLARKETAQAKLELQQLRFPRRLDSDKLKAGIEGIPPQFFEVLYDQSAADGSILAFQIFAVLGIVGWKTDQKLPAPLTPQQGPDNLRDVYQLLPLVQQAGGSLWGVSVVTKAPITEDPKAPERILAMTLLASVASPVQIVGGAKDETMPAGKIRIIVGPKLP